MRPVNVHHDDYAPPMIRLSMGWALASDVYAGQARRDRDRRALSARKQALHDKAVVRRRKRKRGGPK